MSRRNIRHFLSRLWAVLLLPLLVFGAASGAEAATRHTPEDSEFVGRDPKDPGFAVGSKSTAVPGAFWILGADGDAAPSVPEDAEPTATPHVSLPVPAAIWMFGSGLGALALARRRLRGWRHNNRPSAAVVRTAHSIPPRHHQLRQALRERIRLAASGGCLHGEPDGAGVPSAPGGCGGPTAPARPCFINSLTPRFEELAAALQEQPEVSLGRRYGMPCIKLGKRAIVAFDESSHEGIAFRVGETMAAELHAEVPQLDYWNPKHERQPKRSWLVCNVGNGELLAHLAAAAYEQALKDVTVAANQDERFAVAELEYA